jgi:transcriptional regulator GlxA family with amidase domain
MPAIIAESFFREMKRSRVSHGASSQKEESVKERVALARSNSSQEMRLSGAGKVKTCSLRVLVRVFQKETNQRATSEYQQECDQWASVTCSLGQYIRRS